MSMQPYTHAAQREAKPAASAGVSNHLADEPAADQTQWNRRTGSRVRSRQVVVNEFKTRGARDEAVLCRDQHVERAVSAGRRKSRPVEDQIGSRGQSVNQSAYKGDAQAASNHRGHAQTIRTTRCSAVSRRKLMRWIGSRPDGGVAERVQEKLAGAAEGPCTVHKKQRQHQ